MGPQSPCALRVRRGAANAAHANTWTHSWDRTVIRSHFLNLVIFSALVAVFFAFLTQNRTRDRVRVVLVLGGAMIVLSLIVAYVMYPFPMAR
jgi:cell division septal protein FtsQ